MNQFRLSAVGCVLLCWAAVPLAHAEVINQVIFTCEGSQGQIQQILTAPLDAPMDVLDTSGNLVARISSLSWQYVGDPQVILHFSVEAGDAATTFTITSALLSFDPLDNPRATATASLTLTDSNGDGASITGLQGNGKIYTARYNNGVTWAGLNSSFSFIDEFGGAISTDRKPLISLEIIPATVSNIDTQFKFTLSPLDQASGTSTFVVVPEPATLSLLVIGAFAISRRNCRI